MLVMLLLGDLIKVKVTRPFGLKNEICQRKVSNLQIMIFDGSVSNNM